MSQRQLELARDFDRLHGRLRPHEAQSSELSPHDTATITEALDTIRKLNLSGQMRQGAEHLDGNRTGQATQLQQSVVDGLDELLDVFSQRRDAEQRGSAGESPDVQQRLLQLRQAVADWTARQQALLAATESLGTEPDEAPVRDLGLKQQQLAEELAARRGEAWVAATFRLGIEHAERSMREAEERLRQGSPGEATRASQSLAIRRLEMLATSLDTRPNPPAARHESPGERPRLKKRRSRNQGNV